MRAVALLFAFVFAIIIGSYVFLHGYSDDLFTNLDDKEEIAQEEFENLYMDLYKQNFFPDNEKFVLRNSINDQFLQIGPILLNLIEWFEQNKISDPVAQTLINKLNRYLYFVFRKFIVNSSIEKNQIFHIVGLLHKINKCKIINKERSNEFYEEFDYPFRSVLSKTIIFILISNVAKLSYHNKLRHNAHFLDKIRREFFEIKKDISEDLITTSEIDEFVELLQCHAIKEPFLMLGHFMFLFKAMAVILVCTIIMILLIYFSMPYLIKNLRPEWANILSELQKTTDNNIELLKQKCRQHWWGKLVFGSNIKNQTGCPSEQLPELVDNSFYNKSLPETSPGWGRFIWNAICHPIQTLQMKRQTSGKY